MALIQNFLQFPRSTNASVVKTIHLEIYCIDKYQRPTEAQWPKVDGGLLFVEAAEAFSSTPT